MDKWFYQFNRWLAMSKEKKQQIRNRYYRFLARHVGPPYESDPKVFEAERDLQLQQNRWQNERRN